jgi:hypothetical protein
MRDRGGQLLRHPTGAGPTRSDDLGQLGIRLGDPL